MFNEPRRLPVNRKLSHNGRIPPSENQVRLLKDAIGASDVRLRLTSPGPPGSHSGQGICGMMMPLHPLQVGHRASLKDVGDGLNSPTARSAPFLSKWEADVMCPPLVGGVLLLSWTAET